MLLIEAAVARIVGVLLMFAGIVLGVAATATPTELRAATDRIGVSGGGRSEQLRQGCGGLIVMMSRSRPFGKFQRGVC